MGCRLGITAVLHTLRHRSGQAWSQRLNPHVHLHCIVTGGGLSLDGSQWQACQPGYLCDVLALSASFRYYDNLDQGQEKVLTLQADEFIGRFLWHVLPEGFVRIRNLAYSLQQDRWSRCQ